jgi:hypothetical protein
LNIAKDLLVPDCRKTISHLHWEANFECARAT